ncbi:MAG: 4-hydroxy-tetrahydrodipicolinate reductase [Clostridia bacterium]
MNILIYGIGGAMGKTVYNCLREEKQAIPCCGVDKYLLENPYDIPVYKNCLEVDKKIDCIIDFSSHNAVYDYIPYAVKNKIPAVVATTGFNEEEQALIDEASKTIPIFQSGNMSLGVNILMQLVKKTARAIGDIADIEIVETHHNQKADSPSGTAIMLANTVKEELPSTEFIYGREGIVGKRPKKEVGIHAVRGGSVVGKHEITFFMNNEIIKLSHEAESKTIFARGSIKAALFLVKQPCGKYDMNDLLI